MKILHYFLGFPPCRTGGLTKYAFDLAKSQVRDGHDVLALWPGEIKSYYAQPRIKERRKVEGIRNVELINPLPVSLDEGINAFGAYTRPCNIGVYMKWLEEEKPCVIHIHTLMGLHREFIQAANQLGIRTVFTSHDYFGLCPKVTFYRFGECCDNDSACRKCIQCNLKPLSLGHIQIMQSPLYRWAKDNPIVKKLRKHHRGRFFGEEKLPPMPDCNVEELAEEFRKLREYYIGVYQAIDFIHFNSTQTEEIYRRYMQPKDSRVISITHAEIKDKRDNGHVESDRFRIYCLAPAKPFKGWNVLKSACDQLWAEGMKNIELNIYGSVANSSEYMIVHENGYKYEQLSEIMRNADVVVAPSICYETFGFTVLEAISYGVPVIVSNHIGAKDVVGSNGIVVQAGDVDELKNAMLCLAKEQNKDGRKECNHSIKDWESMVEEINELYTCKYNETESPPSGGQGCLPL